LGNTEHPTYFLDLNGEIMRNLLITSALLAGLAAVSQSVVASEELAKKYNCLACHKVDAQLVGPSFQDVAAKYKDDASAAATLAAKVKEGGSGVWGQIPMPPNPSVSDEDMAAMISWVLAQ
jgi:cytochrome c